MSPKLNGPDRRFILALFLSFSATAIFLLPFCNAMYRCGCTWPWAGAADFCNIRTAGMPHCPWCVQRNPLLMALPFLAIFIGQGVAMQQARKHWGSSIAKLLVVGTVAFLVLGAVSGFLFQQLDSYPYYFK